MVEFMAARHQLTGQSELWWLPWPSTTQVAGAKVGVAYLRHTWTCAIDEGTKKDERKLPEWSRIVLVVLTFLSLPIHFVLIKSQFIRVTHSFHLRF